MRDTIDWRDWSERTAGDAAARQKPMLLSLVTAWSEECAAMDAATYRDPAVMSVVESRFVAVRVDADRRPDINERYNLGGWPTNALLTPDGHVLSGGTYLGPAEMIALLNQAADAWRDRADEIRARIADVGRVQFQPRVAGDREPEPDASAVRWFRELLLDQFDPTHGGFGDGPKSPHVPAMQLAAMLADEDADGALKEIVDVTLERIDSLWDPVYGGFYRYADAPDWTRPATEKTLDDNAAVLNLLLDAGVRFNAEPCRERAADLVRWVKHTLADEAGAGFFSSQAAVSRVVDRSMYVDRNADMIGAFLRAATLFEDPWLRDFALKSLETVVVPGYVPGGGVAHEYATAAPVRGLLGDQVRVVSALMRAHAVTGQLPYSMLTLEVMHFAIRTMWDARASCFRDRLETDAPVWPFALNCEAACLLDRLSTLTGEPSYRDRAIQVLGSLASEYQRHGIFAAPYALAIREVVERRPPFGLPLEHVDWHLDKD